MEKLIVDKYGLNDKSTFINYENFLKELQLIICLMAGKVNINIKNELILSMDEIEEEKM